MINTKNTLFYLFVLVLFLSCSSVKKAQNITNNCITISLTECGSYEVKSNQIIIGYAVKPFVIEVDRIKEITEFEQKLKLKYKNKFNKNYRIYAFTTDRDGDVILMTLFLSSKQVENNPNWKCELQEVDTYPKKSKWVDYNCSKNHFKVLGDLD